MTDVLDEALRDAHERFAARRPRTREWHRQARTVLRGGNTRSVLHTRPFPIRVR
jgi:glutamate-1-semialdehyde 2,1-aminomutase